MYVIAAWEISRDDNVAATCFTDSRFNLSHVCIACICHCERPIGRGSAPQTQASMGAVLAAMACTVRRSRAGLRAAGRACACALPHELTTHRMHAGADVHDLDSMRGVGALDMDMHAALRCTQHRRVTGGTHGRERRPAWVRKDLTGINGRARIKASKPPTRAQVLLKQHFAQGLVEATTAMFSRCARAGGTWVPLKPSTPASVMAASTERRLSKLNCMLHNLMPPPPTTAAATRAPLGMALFPLLGLLFAGTC